MPCLRIGTGLGLVIVAFTEKLANPALARVFLQQHPLNFTGWLHIPMSDDIFAVSAGSAELVIGLVSRSELPPTDCRERLGAHQHVVDGVQLGGTGWPSSL